MVRDEAIAAVEIVLKLMQAGRGKLRDVIALRIRRGEDVSMDRAEVAALDSDINNLRDLLADLRAGGAVIGTCPPTEIQAAQRLLDDIVRLVVDEALVAGGLKLVTVGLATARDLRKKMEASA
jgi:hypothetical protein